MRQSTDTHIRARRLKKEMTHRNASEENSEQRIVRRGSGVSFREALVFHMAVHEL